MAKLLPTPVIQSIYKAALAARIDRDTLLAGLPPLFIGTLVRVEQSGAQILTDLLRLNQIDRLDDATVPLREWLETAELLASPLPEALVFRDALRQLNEVKQANVAPPHVEPRPAEARVRDQELSRLLLAMYSADELRRFIRYLPEGRDLEAALPGPTSAPVALVDAVVDVLTRSSAIDQEFFATLIAARPRRRDEIERVQAMFLRS